jgi:hypothetical protein
MNLLCPNCQKMLTVPEQFAGQLMKCPLCAGTFTVPALPAATATAAVAAPAAPPAASPAPSPPPASAPPAPASAAPTHEPEIYSVRDYPAEAPVPANPTPSAPHLVTTTPQPAPAAALEPPPATITPAPVIGGTPGPAPEPHPAVPEGYHHIRSLRLNPRVLPWVAPVCLVVVFFLLFFPWAGVYPGGVPMITASGWGAVFGGGSADFDLKDTPLVGKALEPEKPAENPFAGASILGIFYVLLFFVVLAVTLASVILERVHVKLPPGIQMAMPWRWGIVAASNLVLLLFLALQVWLGFTMESKYKDWVSKNVGRQDPKTTPETKVRDAEQGMALEAYRDTVWLKLTVLLHLVAVIGSFLMFYVDRRGPNRPLPRIDWVT